MALRERLLLHDPSTVRVAQRREAVRSAAPARPHVHGPGCGHAPAAAARAPAPLEDDSGSEVSVSGGSSDTESSDFGSDDADAPAAAELARVRERRLRELRAEAAQADERRRGGAGALAREGEGSCLARLAGAGAAVVHLAAPAGGDGPGEAEETLARLAAQYLGTDFLTVSVAPGSALPLRLRCPPAPCLLAVRSGAVVAATPLSAMGAGSPGGARGEEVERWVRAHGTLLRLRGAGGEESGSEGSEDGEEDAWAPRCETCGRPGYHVHIAATGGALAGGGDGDGDGEGDGGKP